MNIKDYYPDLVIKKECHDDFVSFRIGYDNGKPGAMIITIDTFGIPEDDDYLAYPMGDIKVSFEGSDKVFSIGSIEYLEDFLNSFLWLISEIKKEGRLLYNDT